MSSFLKFTCVVANDLERLRDFYGAALNMPVRFQDGARWCQLDGGKVDLALASPLEASPCPGGVINVFEVDSLLAACDRVLGAGGRVLQERSMGSHGTVVTCADTEGNHFQLFSKERKDPT